MGTTLQFRLLIGVLGLVIGLAASGPASAQCPKLSDVEWWTNTVPEVQRVVVASYNGNWTAYIDRWKQQRRELQTAFDTQTAVEIKSRALVFRGDDLKDYIRLVDERIATLECLKNEYASATTPAAAKGKAAPVQQELSAPQEVKAIEGQELSLEVAALCQDGVPAFQITNLGDRWPRLGEVSIFRTDTNGKLTQRRIRMSNSQQMLFKVPDEISKDAVEVGIFIEPSWYDRKFSYDAKIKC